MSFQNSVNMWPTLPKSNSDVPADIPGALTELGVKITEVNETDVIGFCPWHDEGTTEQHKPRWGMLLEGYRNPRTNEYVKPGMFNCFSCGWKGDFRVLVMKLLNTDEIGADSWIAQHKIINLDRAREKLYKAPMVKTPEFIPQESHLAAFTDPPPMALLKRKITLEVCQQYDVRWDGEHFVLPVREPNGNLIGWQLKNEKYFMNVPNGMKMHHTLFGLQQAEKKVAVALVESPLDVLWLRINNINAVGTYGKNVSDAQMQLVLDNFLVVKVALDQDAKKESLSIKRRYGYRIPMWFFNYEGISGNDPGDCRASELTKGFGNATFSPYYR